MVTLHREVIARMGLPLAFIGYFGRQTELCISVLRVHTYIFHQKPRDTPDPTGSLLLSQRARIIGFDCLPPLETEFPGTCPLQEKKTICNVHPYAPFFIYIHIVNKPINYVSTRTNHGKEDAAPADLLNGLLGRPSCSRVSET